MKNKTGKRQFLLAAVLLLAFLFIHGVKFLHHHHGSSEIFLEKTGEKQTIKNASCAICDYYFAKEATEAQPDPSQVFHVFSKPALVFKPGNYYAADQDKDLTRGPPAC